MNNQSLIGENLSNKEFTALKRRKKISRGVRLGLIYFVLVFEAFCFMFPYYLKLVESLNSLTFVGEYGKIYLFPQGGIHFENYLTAIRSGDLIGGLFNTIFSTFFSVSIGLIFAYVMGYAFAKMRFHGRNVLFVFLLSALMVPGEVLIVPLYLITVKLNLIDSLWGVVLPGLLNVFGVFLIKQYMSSIPDSVIEAAKIDGAGQIKIMFQIVFQMSLPIVATFVIINFTGKWNEYLWPQLILFNPDLFTLQLKMISLTPAFAGKGTGVIRSAALILITAPIVVLFCFCQKYYLRSMNLAGIK